MTKKEAELTELLRDAFEKVSAMGYACEMFACPVSNDTRETVFATDAGAFTVSTAPEGFHPGFTKSAVRRLWLARLRSELHPPGEKLR